MNTKYITAAASLALVLCGLVVAQPYINMASGEMEPEATFWGRCPEPRWEVFSYIPPQGGADEPAVLLGTGVVHAIILVPKGDHENIYIAGLRGQTDPMELRVPAHTLGTSGLYLPGSESLILNAIFDEALIISGSVQWSDSEQAWIPTGRPPAFTLLWKSDV